MKNTIFKFLKNYSTDPLAIDRLLISAYLKINNRTVTKNQLLNSYCIADDDEGYSNLNEFIKIIKNDFDELTLEHLTQLFEFVISPADRIITGAIYTPLEIREYIINQIITGDIPNGYTIADIACGCGGFLLSAAKKIRTQTNKRFAEIFSTHIFGLDIEVYSAKRAELLLSLLALEEGEDEENYVFRIFTGDALVFNWQASVVGFNGFSAIVGNPPYVCSRNIKSETKTHLNKWSVCRSGHPDLYIPFFQIGLELLKDAGKLGYITMNSFFKSLNGRALRAYFHDLSYQFEIIDFGNYQVFGKRSTYTCLCFISKSHSEDVRYIKLDSLTELPAAIDAMISIRYDDLRPYEGWNLQNNHLISKIERTGLPFSSVYKTRNGIATLKNEVYIFTPSDEDDHYYYFGEVSIEKNICQDIINPNLLTNQSDLNAIIEKIIFPYYFKNGKAIVFSESEMETVYPSAYQYLLSQKKILDGRDNGEGEYPEWFAFGRTQSLERMRYKLFFPHITPHLPNYIINDNEGLTFYNGIAVIGKNMNELVLLKKIMSSRLFWYYIRYTSKPYSAKYYSLSKNYIKHFGIYPFNETDTAFLLSENDQAKIDSYLERLYDIEL